MYKTYVSNIEPIALFHSMPCTSEAINEDNKQIIEVGKEKVNEEFKNCLELLQPVSLFPSFQRQTH